MTDDAAFGRIARQIDRLDDKFDNFKDSFEDWRSNHREEHASIWRELQSRPPPPPPPPSKETINPLAFTLIRQGLNVLALFALVLLIVGLIMRPDLHLTDLPGIGG